MGNNEECYSCPCCGFLTLSEETHETFEICPVCHWEEDDVQFNNPDFRGGANQESLNEAKENYKKFGAAAQKYIKAVRTPFPDEIP
ncbi:MAG: CPCC family cysteine-rich protein [Bacteriovoracaceae bacterium]